MKKLLVFIPATLLVLFLLNSFVLKEKETTKKAAKSVALNIVFRSADGGRTWQNISKGLPENLQRAGVWSGGFFTNDHGFYLRAANGVYHSAPTSVNTFWTKDTFTGIQRNIAPGQNGVLVYNFRGQFFKKINGEHDWSPMYTNFQEQAVRLNGTVDWMYKNYKEKQVSSVFESTGGTVFVGSNNAVYRSANSGKTWEYVPVKGWVMNMIESDGVLMALGSKGILRSTDDGRTWVRVIGEAETGVAVERIDGGFAAITNNGITKTNSVHLSFDNGKTWNNIAERFQSSWYSSLIKKFCGEQSSSYISSIKQAGKYLICSGSDGIFRSSDKGKTWEKLLFPSTENKGFALSVSGDVIYAMPLKGC